MKLSTAIPLAFLIACLIFGVLYFREHDARLVAESRALAQADTLRQVTHTASMQRSILVTEREAKAALSGELQAVLRKMSVQSVTRVTLAARPESTVTARPATVTVDTVWQHDVIAADLMVNFSERIGRYTVTGWTHSLPPEVWLKVTQDDIRLTVVATEMARHQFAFAADTGDTSLVVTAIDGRVVLRRPGLWARAKPWVLFGVGVVLGKKIL